MRCFVAGARPGRWKAETVTEPEPRRGRFLHRHTGRRLARPSSAHVADSVHPSPARAEPHDATAWLPLPEIGELPPLDDLLALGPDVEPPVARDVPVGLPSPARAEPHDATAWLPLPEVEELPPVDDLLTPDPSAPAPREVPVGLPSPARAEPHDPGSWLPIPDLAASAGTGGDEPPIGGSPRQHRRPRRGFHFPFRRVVTFVVIAAVMFGAYTGVSKLFDPGADVDLRVGGKVISTQTGTATVAGLLSENHITLGDHDRVVPGLKAHITNGMTVDVLRAFSVVVNFDGDAKTVFTTRGIDTTQFLADAASQLGITSPVGLRNPPKRITQGQTLQLRTYKRGTLLVDGQTVQYNAPLYQVRELLEDYKVKLGPQDVTVPYGANDALPEVASIAVNRVLTDTTYQDEPYSVPDQQQPDATLPVDKTRLVAGHGGTQRVTYELVHHNGVVVQKIPISYVPIVPAVPNITYYGTVYDPRWDKIAQCETGTNWQHRGSGPAGPNTYQGGLGIWYGNWKAQGGTAFAPSADQATKYEQIIIAMRIQKKYGWGAWGCGKTLGYAKEDGKRIT